MISVKSSSGNSYKQLALQNSHRFQSSQSFQSRLKTNKSLKIPKKSNIKEKIGVKLSHIPISILGGIVWIGGDIINLFVQKYSYKTDPDITDKQCFDFLTYKVSKILGDILFYYLPAGFIERLSDKTISHKIVSSLLKSPKHARFQPLLKVISLMIASLATLPFNDIAKPWFVAKLTSYIIKHKDNLPVFLQKLLTYSDSDFDKK